MLASMWRKGNLSTPLVGMYIGAASMEISMQVKTLKTELPAIPLLGIFLKKTLSSKRYMHPNVRTSTVYNSQDMETTYMSINR